MATPIQTMTTSAQKTSTEIRSRPLGYYVEQYGDLIFDLCESVLWSPTNAQIAFFQVLKALEKHRSAGAFYEVYERAWVLGLTVERLKRLSARLGRRLSPSEQVMLDASLPVTQRLVKFDSYFHRLMPDDQILLILRDKYGLPYTEISAAIGLPEGSLKIRRQQALATLEVWLWDRR